MKSFVFFACQRAPVRLAASTLAMMVAFPVLAQSQAVGTLGEVVVTATRAKQALSDVLADLTIVDSDQIQRSGATGLADVLGRLPGVEFQRNGGPGATTSVYIRGAETRFTAVFVDGVRIDSQSTGGASWESIPLAQVDHIEVLRGPAAAVYGSDALSGVVQIFTRRGEGDFSPYLGFGMGTYGTKRSEAGFSGQSGNLDYSLGLVDEKSDGFNARPIAGQNPDLDGYNSQSANLKLGYQVNNAHRLEVTYLKNDLDSQYDSAGTSTDNHSLYELETDGLSWQAQWTDAWSSRLSATSSHNQYKTMPEPSYLTITNLKGYLWHNEIRQGEHLVTVDLERKEDHLENAPINQDRFQNGVALGYGFSGKQHLLQLNVRHDDDSEFGGKSTASAAYGYAITGQWRATASAATAFRVPTLFQRFSAYGDPSLQPETGKNIEMGLRYTEGSSSFGAVVFRNEVSNLITYVNGAGACASSYGCYANTARAVYEGITLTATHRLGGVNLGASLDLQDPHDVTTGLQLARRAKQHAMLTADTRLGAWTLGAEAQLSGQRYDTAANTLVLPGYGLINLHASTNLSKDWSLVMKADNLSDKTYQLADGYAQAGRTVYVGVKWAPM
ncbi:TonB-dependent receptor domain-containing protein [Rhodoferax sp.]|uniref:TonB-dependent receptor domain-containing protein n=1 Tax=Rhodoferax sp. TaxID=50421 RepID=UPI00284977B2|nr:TonB-dependent receptor [Rhodoferax sp.]MDR3370309.1 TonB-dependent receptor [Rhodoferax sp.]